MFSSETWCDLTCGSTRLVSLAALQATYTSLQSFSCHRTGFLLVVKDNKLQTKFKRKAPDCFNWKKGEFLLFRNLSLLVLISAWPRRLRQRPSWCRSDLIGRGAARCALLQHELVCKTSYHFPLGLGGHAGVAVHQRLGGLWERVGDTVAEALAQTSSEEEEQDGEEEVQCRKYANIIVTTTKIRLVGSKR